MSTRKKLCLVTGACGFTGSFMVELLLEKGYRVRATDLEKSERGINFEVIKKSKAEFIPADLTKKETLSKIVKDVDYVFHVAAVFEYSDNWEKLYQVNVEGTRNLCQAISEHNKKKIKKFILWSSGSVYGLPEKRSSCIDECKNPNPCNLYGKSKLMQEKVALEYKEKYNLPLVIMRCVPIYGPRNIYGLANLWLTYCKMPFILMAKKFPIGFPYVHVKDVCNAALFLAENKEPAGEVYNVIDDKKYSTHDFFETMSKLLHKKFVEIPVNFKLVTSFFRFTANFLKFFTKLFPLPNLVYLRETMPYSTVDYRFSNDKLKELGYKFMYPTRERGLEETIKWFEKIGMLKVK